MYNLTITRGYGNGIDHLYLRLTQLLSLFEKKQQMTLSLRNSILSIIRNTISEVSDMIDTTNVAVLT